MEKEWKAKAQQLQIELAALRMHALVLSKDLETTKLALTKERAALQKMEYGQLDMPHDFKELLLVCDRLNSENSTLRRKVQRRDNGNESLREEIDKLNVILSCAQEESIHHKHTKARGMWTKARGMWSDLMSPWIPLLDSASCSTR